MYVTLHFFMVMLKNINFRLFIKFDNIHGAVLIKFVLVKLKRRWKLSTKLENVLRIYQVKTNIKKVSMVEFSYSYCYCLIYITRDRVKNFLPSTKLAISFTNLKQSMFSSLTYMLQIRKGYCNFG